MLTAQSIASQSRHKYALSRSKVAYYYSIIFLYSYFLLLSYFIIPLEPHAFIALALYNIRRGKKKRKGFELRITYARGPVVCMPYTKYGHPHLFHAPSSTASYRVLSSWLCKSAVLFRSSIYFILTPHSLWGGSDNPSLVPMRALCCCCCFPVMPFCFLKGTWLRKNAIILQ